MYRVGVSGRRMCRRVIIKFDTPPAKPYNRWRGGDSLFSFMRQSQLNRTLKLVRRTGDKVIILDRDSDEAFVLMDLDNYEMVLDMTDLPKDSDSDPDLDEEDPLEDYVLDDAIDAEEKASEMPPLAVVEEKVAEIKIEPIVDQNMQEIKTNIISEESLEDVPHEDQDTFLLEPIE